MGQLREIPLFPLNTVLFPGMVLPLHIFEPRYRLMIGRCIKDNSPFGVVLIKEGVEVGGSAVPHDVGTTAYVTHAQRLPDGRMTIHTVGHQRFRLHEVRHDQPYLTGMVEEIPMNDGETPQIAELTSRLSEDLSNFLRVYSASVEKPLEIERIPDDALGLAFFAAIVLPLPSEEKQDLLSTEDLLPLLKAEKAILRREWMLLQHMIEHQASEPTTSSNDDPPLFSVN